MPINNNLNFLTKIGHLWLKKSMLWAIVISIVFIGLQLFLIVIFYSQLPSRVPLFYSRPWGQPQLAESIYLLLLPGASLAALITNSVISAIFVDRKAFYSHCLTWTSTIFSTFCLITLIKIIQILV